MASRHGDQMGDAAPGKELVKMALDQVAPVSYEAARQNGPTFRSAGIQGRTHGLAKLEWQRGGTGHM